MVGARFASGAGELGSWRRNPRQKPDSDKKPVLRVFCIAAFWTNSMCHSGGMEVGSAISVTGEAVVCGQILVAKRHAAATTDKLRTLRWGVRVLTCDNFGS